jgi:hypothetical protein
MQSMRKLADSQTVVRTALNSLWWCPYRSAVLSGLFADRLQVFDLMMQAHVLVHQGTAISTRTTQPATWRQTHATPGQATTAYGH